MAKIYTLLAVAVVFLAIDPKVDSSQEVMKDLSVTFGKLMNECMKELNIPDTATGDFYSFWKEDYVITNRDTGCLILCLARKWDMHHPDGKLHKENTIEFAKKYGADEAMAIQLVDILHACEKETTNSDECLRVMGIANCFKKEVHKLNWAPPANLVAEELMADL